MTNDQLEAIRRRAAAATRGPWETRLPAQIVGVPDRAAVQREGSLLDWIASMQVSNNPGWRADADFIAHAREDIPALLAEIGRLKALVGAEETP